jgi:hypothetical protein
MLQPAVRVTELASGDPNAFDLAKFEQACDWVRLKGRGVVIK